MCTIVWLFLELPTHCAQHHIPHKTSLAQIESVETNAGIAKESLQTLSEELDATVEDLGVVAEAAATLTTCVADVSARTRGKPDASCTCAVLINEQSDVFGCSPSETRSLPFSPP